MLREGAFFPLGLLSLEGKPVTLPKISVMKNILTFLIDKKLAEHRNGQTAFSFKHSEKNTIWHPTTWQQLATERNQAAAALEILGVGEQEMISVFSANRPEIIVTDFAAFSNRAVPVSIYSTSSLEQVKYIVADSRSSIIFVGNEAQYIIAREVMKTTPCLKHIVCYDDVKADFDDRQTLSFREFLELGAHASEETLSRLAARTAKASPDDIATLIYTSGTTGEPKGAILTHSNFDAAFEMHDRRLTSLSEKDTSLSFLPLSHIFEKAWSYYCLYKSIQVFINHDPRDITTSLREVHPTCMCAVPRFWEKAYTLIQDKMSRQKGLKRLMVKWALSVGRRRNLNYARVGRKAPWPLEMAYGFFYKNIFRPVQRVMGVEKGNLFPTAGAPLSDAINAFFHSIGVNIVIGYGLSETTATVTCYPSEKWKIGTVGTPLDGLKVRIGAENEIEVCGPTVMRGYFNKPDATAEAFTSDGWFRTGDAGAIDSDGNLIITDRLKDLFKTSNGKYVAPQAIETLLGEDPFIEQVAVIGDKRKYVTAIIIPAFDALKEYARENNITYRTVEDLIANPSILEMMQRRINSRQADLAGFEKVKKFTLLPREFTMESGELTNTLKLRRKIINSRYAREIEKMY